MNWHSRRIRRLLPLSTALIALAGTIPALASTYQASTPQLAPDHPLPPGCQGFSPGTNYRGAEVEPNIDVDRSSGKQISGPTSAITAVRPGAPLPPPRPSVAAPAGQRLATTTSVPATPGSRSVPTVSLTRSRSPSTPRVPHSAVPARCWSASRPRMETPGARPRH